MNAVFITRLGLIKLYFSNSNRKDTKYTPFCWNEIIITYY